MVLLFLCCCCCYFVLEALDSLASATESSKTMTQFNVWIQVSNTPKCIIQMTKIYHISDTINYSECVFCVGYWHEPNFLKKKKHSLHLRIIFKLQSLPLRKCKENNICFNEEKRWFKYFCALNCTQYLWNRTSFV